MVYNNLAVVGLKGGVFLSHFEDGKRTTGPYIFFAGYKIELGETYMGFFGVRMKEKGKELWKNGSVTDFDRALD